MDACTLTSVSTSVHGLCVTTSPFGRQRACFSMDGAAEFVWSAIVFAAVLCASTAVLAVVFIGSMLIWWLFIRPQPVFDGEADGVQQARFP